jgi:superkiller protein 3
MLTLLLISCSSEQKEAPIPVSTEKNLFEELKEQTVKNPKDAEAWYHLADLYERSEMYREEVETLGKVLAIDPDKAYAYVKLGSAYSRLGQYQDAIKSFKTAIKYFPQNPVLYNNLAVSYGKVNKTEDEITMLKKAISLRPQYATARYNLGIALLKRGDREGALQQYTEINKFDGGVATALKKELDSRRK